VEFIVGPSGDFYFMEINTRLQVEHPVTELTLHLDLVELQLRVAAGEALPASLIRNKSVPQDGHAIEVRLYAEDPSKNFLPGSGKLQRLQLPTPDAHVRIDSGVIEGDTVTIFYDPMIAKMIVWDRTREAALLRLREALAQSDVDGPKSNIAFLERLVRHPAIVEGRIDTGYLDRHLDEFLPHAGMIEPLWIFAAATVALLDEEARVREAALTDADPHSPWHAADAFRLGHAGKRIVCLEDCGERIEIAAYGAAGDYTLSFGEATCRVEHAKCRDGNLSASFDGVMHRFAANVDASRIVLHDGERRTRLERARAFAYTASASKADDRILAPMPGRIVLVKVKAGDAVAEGQELLVMEAMKMELSLKASHAATIEAIHVASGDFVEADTVLVKFGENK
jgi:3-methylcrotonyl-CoA carboxylase alpha subunit